MTVLTVAECSVRDGRYRVSATCVNGQLEIEALVTVWER